MTKTFDKQVVLITGAGQGIGKQLAREFAARGAVIAGVDLKLEPLQKLLEELKAAGAAEPVGAVAVADVTNRPQLHAAVKELTDKLGPVDVLVANAGIGIENPCVPNFSAEIFEKQIAVNLNGVANSVETVLPKMVERKEGHIVTLSSLASYRGLPLMAGYCASKAGVAALMDSLRFELKPLGIHCTTICPGWIKTDLVKQIEFPMPGILSVEEAVRKMMEAIEKKKPYVAFPLRNRFNLSLSQILPASWADYLLNRELTKQGAKGVWVR